jgi:hypothetical protein
MRTSSEGGKLLPYEMIRDELQALAPAQFAMVDYMLGDLMDRAPMLSDRDQIRELMIVVLSALSPGFPHILNRRPLDS